MSATMITSGARVIPTECRQLPQSGRKEKTNPDISKRQLRAIKTKLPKELRGDKCAAFCTRIEANMTTMPTKYHFIFHIPLT